MRCSLAHWHQSSPRSSTGTTDADALPVGLLERHKKRSGIPIAPSGTECVARRDDAKRSLSSPTRRSDCGCDERFPRKDPGVFDLLGSSLSCDATVLAVPISICTYGLPNPCGVQRSHLRKWARHAGTRCCQTRQTPLKPGTP